MSSFVRHKWSVLVVVSRANGQRPSHISIAKRGEKRALKMADSEKIAGNRNGQKNRRTQSRRTKVRMVRLFRLGVIKELDGGFEDFVFAGDDAGDGRLDADVGLNA